MVSWVNAILIRLASPNHLLLRVGVWAVIFVRRWRLLCRGVIWQHYKRTLLESGTRNEAVATGGLLFTDLAAFVVVFLLVCCVRACLLFLKYYGTIIT